MTGSDNDLREFFQEMRAADSSQDIPDFESMKQVKPSAKNYWLPLSAAASLLVIICSYFILRSPVTSSDSIELVITLGPTEETGTQNLIKEPTTIDSWTPPTNTLITDF